MKTTLKSLLFSALALLAFSCGKPEDDPVKTPYLNTVTKSLDFEAEGGTSTITFSANMDWTISCAEDWLSFSPTSGSGSTSTQDITVTAKANDDYAVRTATLSITVSTVSKNVLISQAAKKDDGFRTVDIKTFRDNIKSDKNTWYRLVAEVASIASYDYGNLYLTDGTGYVYVYGLCSTKPGLNESGNFLNDQSFSTIGIKPGDRISILTTRGDYQGTIEASGSYIEKVTPGSYNGWKASSTKAAWMELPATSDADGHDLLAHMFHTDGFSGRSYSAYWDYENRVSLWEAYPLFAKSTGSGKRSDAWAFDPLLPVDGQYSISKSSFKKGNGDTYIRGHQVPSADRLNYRENIDMFFSTNIFPQNSTLNEGVWETLEDNVRTWANKCDTLYVVTGVDVKGSTTYVYDNNEKKVTVPVGCFKAVLRYSATEGYSGAGFYFENAKPASGTTWKSKAMSIDALEEKVGFDFFVNLVDAVGSKAADEIEATLPANLAWLN